MGLSSHTLPESEGPHSDEGRGQPDPAGNVVRFPRDWFGPREELVPFGPRVSQTGVVDLEPPAPVRPDDFWGEDSASIHDVLQAPDAVEPTPIVVEVGAPPAPRARRSLVSRARGRFRGRWSVRGARLPRPRVVSVVVAAVAALACSAVALATLGASPLRGPPRGAVRADRVVAHPSPAALVIGSAIRWRTPRRHTASRHRALTVHHKAHASVSSVASPGASGAPAATRVSNSQPVTGHAQPASTTSTAPGAGAASAGGGGSGGGTAAGPQGPGAAFGPGHLG